MSTSMLPGPVSAGPPARAEGLSAAIVLTVRDAAALTLRTLVSLAETPAGADFHTVIVDDGSRDATPTLLTSVSGDFTPLREDGPRGQAAGSDRAFAASAEPIVVFLREDLILCAGWLQAILEPFADPQVGAVRPRVLDIAGREVAEASWPCLAVRREAHERVGGLSGAARAGRPVRATYLEAIDAAGWAIASAPGAVILCVPEAASEAAGTLEVV